MTHTSKLEANLPITQNDKATPYFEDYLYTNLYSYKLDDDNAVIRTRQSKDEETVSIKDFGAQDGEDAYEAITAAIAYLKTQGGGKLIFPNTASGEWLTSQGIVIDFPIWLHFEADLTGTFTTKQDLLLFEGTLNTNIIKGITVTSDGLRTLNHNGGDITDYTYGFGDPGYSAMRVYACEDIFIEGLEFKNGLVCGLLVEYSRRTKVNKCEARNTVYDNGISINQSKQGSSYLFDQTVLDTYANSIVLDCYAEYCNDYGFTAYDSPGTYFVRCRSEYCGNETDTSSQYGGGFSYEDDVSNPHVNSYQGGFIECKAFNCTARGFRITCDGVFIDDHCESYSTTWDSTDTNGFYGHGVVAESVDCYVGGYHHGNSKSGLFTISGQTGPYYNLDIKGHFADNDQYGIYLHGIDVVRILPGTKVVNNGVTDSKWGVYISNDNFGTDNYYNVNNGYVYIDESYFEANEKYAIKCDYLKIVSICNNTGKDNSQFGAGQAILVEKTETAYVINNRLIDEDGNQNFIINIASSVRYSYVWGNQGDHTASTTISLANSAKTRYGMTKLTLPDMTLTASASYVAGELDTVIGAINSIRSVLRTAGVISYDTKQVQTNFDAYLG